MCQRTADIGRVCIGHVGSLQAPCMSWLPTLAPLPDIHRIILLQHHAARPACHRFNPDLNRQRAIHMITTWTGTQAYIGHVVTPLVKHLRRTFIPSSNRTRTYADAVLAYEVFNEPEGTSWDTRLYHNYMC